MNSTVLILPGIGNSGPDHWQSRWEKDNPSFMRVQQNDWDHAVCAEWLAVLENSVARVGTDAVLVAHSLACLLVAHWASSTKLKIKGALLVAPPNPNGPNFPQKAIGFSPVLLRRLTFPSIVVASTNDPYGSLDFAKSAAVAWGSPFVNIGAAGHINSESGLGDWNEGFSLLRQLV
ncbi:MAG: alpha/beta hydrolase [Gammaproteobacteria bacterium]|nr:alpha/beta hydrolase [Gammaproteobacteria bacterium]